MASAVTYEGSVQRSAPAGVGLFSGQKLWFSRGVPSRAWLMQNAELNGAHIVQLEQQADVKLVDHAKKNQAPGTHSYQYVERSIANGCLEDLDSHRVGSTSRVNRPIGSIVTASKGSRNKFTHAEDQLLWDWVKPFMDAGGAWKGLEIYKQLETINPSHTYQSWRDRWIKHTRYQNRQITAHPQTSHDEAYDQAKENPRPTKRRRTNEKRVDEPQRANISAIQSRQRQPANEAAKTLAMGNTESSSVGGQEDTEHAQLKACAEQDEKEHAEIQSEANKVDEHPSGNHVDDAVIEKPVQRGLGKMGTIDDTESSVSADGNRLPLAFNFTQDEARMLYKATCHILDARTDKLEESWGGVAGEYGHTKEAWQTFFYDFIVPEYMKRHDIHTEAELEIHYKIQIREQRERKARETATEQEQEAEKNVVGFQQQQTSTVLAEADKAAILHHNQVDSTNVSKTSDEVPDKQLPSRLREHQVEPRPPPSDLVFIQYRPPKPNESRKLSQGKGSQSTSSQSISLSISQQSQHSQPLASLFELPKILHVADGSEQAQSRHNAISEANLTWHGPDSDGFQLSGREKQGSQSLTRTCEHSEEGEGRDEYSSQFVTQRSQSKQPSTTQSSTELQDIPFRDPTPPLPRTQFESPLFVAEDPGRSSPKFTQIRPNQHHSEPQSSPAAVQLIDGDIAEFENGLLSEYAPSEAPSEGIQFESQAQLSQAWETAPDDLSDSALRLPKNEQADGVYGCKSQQDHHPPMMDHARINDKRTHRLIVLSASGEVSSNTNMSTLHSRASSQRNKRTEADFETAPEVPQTKPATIDTQALFQRPTQASFTELAAIPEPLGGWDDNEALTEDIPHQDTSKSAQRTAIVDVDWTLPLPDLDNNMHDAPLSPSSGGDSEDIDNWLAKQPKTYTSIPSMLLNPLSHRALESTSMDLNIANTVLASMIQRFEKGKYPANLSLSDIRKLPKRERKPTISSIAEELLPSNMRGCWTRDDDKALRGVNGREVKMVEDKHGEDGMRNRFEFLEMWHAM